MEQAYEEGPSLIHCNANFENLDQIFIYIKKINHNVALLWYLAICLFKFDLILAACGQYGQWKGFSPVWVRICRITKTSALNCLPQMLHA